MRIVSLSPSATETLCFVGGASLLVGRTARCTHPPEIAGVPVVDPADERWLAELKPDLILSGCEGIAGECGENDGNGVRFNAPGHTVARLSPAKVLALDPDTVEGIVDACLTVGAAAGLHESAQNAAIALRGRLFQACDCVNPYVDGPSVAVLASLNPLVVAGRWVSQLVERAGGRHPLNPTTAQPQAGSAAGPQQAQRDVPLPRPITPEELAASSPDLVVVGVGGDGVMEVSLEAGKRAVVGSPWLNLLKEGTRVVLVDGSIHFSHWSPRIADDLCFLSALINDRPELTPPGYGWVML